MRRPRRLRRLGRDILQAILVAGTAHVRPVDIDELVAGHGPPVRTYPLDSNLLVLAALCSQPDVETAFEIGTFRGRASFAMAAAGATVTTLDVSDDDAIGSAFAGTPEAERITQLVGDSMQFDFSPYLGAVDLVYIDGAHDYKHVLNDTEKALPLLTEQGIIAWDDFPAEPGVFRYLNEFAPQHGELLHVRATRLVLYSPRRQLLNERG